MIIWAVVEVGAYFLSVVEHEASGPSNFFNAVHREEPVLCHDTKHFNTFLAFSNIVIFSECCKWQSSNAYITLFRFLLCVLLGIN